jgi:hypothetical protein
LKLSGESNYLDFKKGAIFQQVETKRSILKIGILLLAIVFLFDLDDSFLNFSSTLLSRGRIVQLAGQDGLVKKLVPQFLIK